MAGTTLGTVWRQLLWRGIDDPRRMDSAEVELASDWLQARGETVLPDYRLTWSLTTGLGFVTETLRARIDGGTWSRRLTLRRDRSGRWSDEAEAHGELAAQPPPGLVDAAYALDGALDCELGPASVTMPVRRHGLHAGGEVARHEALVARVEVPSLAVVPARRCYSRAPDGGVRFDTLDHPWSRADLTIDTDGLLLEFPHHTRRVT
jgi:uncharacterized protein